MWIIIILALILIFLIAGYRNKEKIANQIEAKGGMGAVYPVLISHFLDSENAVVVEKKKDSITINDRYGNYVAAILIIQNGDQVSVKIRFFLHQTKIASKTFGFPMNASQYNMIDVINHWIATQNI